MPRIRESSAELDGPSVTLEGEAHRYLARVLRVQSGDAVDLFDGRGLEVGATVTSVGPRDLTLALGERRRMPLPDAPPVTLLQGLPRAERMDLLVQKAAALGAPALHTLVPAKPSAGAVLIGPEGGLTHDEVALATSAGFEIATLGPRILRTETAAIAALAAIQSRVGGLG